MGNSAALYPTTVFCIMGISAKYWYFYSLSQLLADLWFSAFLDVLILPACMPRVLNYYSSLYGEQQGKLQKIMQWKRRFEYSILNIWRYEIICVCASWLNKWVNWQLPKCLHFLYHINVMVVDNYGTSGTTLVSA